MSAGEAVGDAVFDYCPAQLRVTVNEMFGQPSPIFFLGYWSKRGPKRSLDAQYDRVPDFKKNSDGLLSLDC